MDQASDIELINKYLKNNDQESFNLLIKKYLDMIYNFTCIYVGNKEDVDDVVQNTFVKVWKNIKKFNIDKNFKTWIFEIAKNTSLDYLKKKKNINFSELNNSSDNDDEFINLIKDDNFSPSEIFENKENAYLVKSEIEKLSIKYKQIINLYYFNDFNFREISEILKESIDTVKSKHRRALILLRENLNKNRNIIN